MRRRVVKPLLLLLLLAPAPVLGHGDGEPWLFVAADRVHQGQSFTVIGADMGPSVLVEFDLLSHEELLPLGEVTTAEDGHFETTLVVPATLRDGYAELRAVDTAGLEASTWLLVGDTVDPAVTAPPVPRSSPWWTDPSVIVLGAALVGATGAVGVLLFRSRRPDRVPAVDRARPMHRKRRRSHRA